MEVTIEYKEETTPPFRTETHQSFFGRVKTRQVPQPAGTSYNVYLYVVPSEEERAVILKYRVGELTFHEEQEYTPQQIEEAHDKFMALNDRFQKRLLSMPTESEVERMQQEMEHWERELEHRQKAKIGIKLEEFFDNPFIRSFDHPQAAQMFIDRLQGTILPKIKNYIGDFANRSDKLTFNL